MSDLEKENGQLLWKPVTQRDPNLKEPHYKMF